MRMEKYFQIVTQTDLECPQCWDRPTTPTPAPQPTPPNPHPHKPHMYTSRIPSHIPAVYIAKGINVFDFVFEEGIVHPLIIVYYNYVIISVMYMSTMLRNNKMCYRIAGVCIAQSMLLLRCTVKLAGTLCFHLIHTCTCVITSYVLSHSCLLSTAKSMLIYFFPETKVRDPHREVICLLVQGQVWQCLRSTVAQEQARTYLSRIHRTG